jgi:hypothetical protein
MIQSLSERFCIELHLQIPNTYTRRRQALTGNKPLTVQAELAALS